MSELRQRNPRSSEGAPVGGPDLSHEMMAKGTMLKDQMCDMCRSQFRQYPKLMVGLLVLSSFCLGIGLTAMMGRMGYGPGGNLIRIENRDPTAIEAHQALDTLLSHVYSAKSSVSGATEKLSKLEAAKLAAEALKKGHDLRDSAGDTIDGLGSKLSGLKDNVGHTLNDHVGYAGEKLSQGADSIKHGATRSADYLSEQAQILRDTLSEKATETADALKHGAQEIKYRVVPGSRPEPGLKGKLHEAEAKISDILHNAADTLKHKVGA